MQLVQLKVRSGEIVAEKGRRLRRCRTEKYSSFIQLFLITQTNINHTVVHAGFALCLDSAAAKPMRTAVKAAGSETLLGLSRTKF